MNNKENCYIFIILNPIIEILVSRIIEDFEKNNIPKESILILHPKEYTPALINDVTIVCFDMLKDNINEKSKNLKLKIQFFLYLFRRASTVFGKRIYRRLGKLPVSIMKLYSYQKFIEELHLKNKEIFIYTPNVKVHIFQILIFYTGNFNYHILEEGAVSFKSINDTERLFAKDLRLLAADLIGGILFKMIFTIRLTYDIVGKFLLSSSIPFNIFLKYISTPIFKDGMFFLPEYIPLSFNKISEKAFSSFKDKGIDSFLYKKISRYEIMKKNEVSKLIKELKTDKIYILILPGDNINILNQEFDNRKTRNFKPYNLVLRPHPRLSGYSIKKLSKLLEVEISEENIILSEIIRSIPIEILFKMEEIRLVFTGLQKSSLLMYCDNENVKYSIY